MEEVNKEIGQLCKSVFSSAEGQKVFDFILLQCNILDSCQNERDLGREDFAKELITIMYKDNDGIVKRHKFLDLFSRLVKEKLKWQMKK